MTIQHAVTRLEGSQRHALGDALSAAFLAEPNFTYMLPNPTHRRSTLAWFFRTIVAGIGLGSGEIYTTAMTNGGAVWLKPGHTVTFAASVRVGILAMPFVFGWHGFRRSLAVSTMLDQARLQYAPAQHWYLMALGVIPTKQGQGLGGALLHPILAHADATGLPCYLETFKPRTVAFYEHHGFRVVFSDQITGGGPAFWTLVRHPHTVLENAGTYKRDADN